MPVALPWLAGFVTVDSVGDTQIRSAADRLLTAQRLMIPTDPVRDLIGADDVDAAYAVQEQIILSRIAGGAKPIGRKIGLTSAAVQRQVGVDQPDFGVLLDDMLFFSGSEIDTATLLQPKAEAEIAFVLADDIDDLADIAGDVGRFVEYACAALEIVDSRVQDWDVAITDTVADNASSGVFVLADDRHRLDDVVPREVTMQMTINAQQVSTGDGTACLGDPLEALRWLAATSIRIGAPLRAGEVVLSGALGPLAPIVQGDTLTATLSSLGSVTTTFR